MGFWSGSEESTQTVTPWAPATKPLKEHLGMIHGQDPWSVYGGDTLAGFNPDQLRMMQGVRDYMGAGGWGNQAMNGLFGQGMDMLGGFGQAQNYFGNAMSQDAIRNQGADMGMAAEYANNPYLSGQIDAASRDVTRNLYENQMPGIAAYSAGSGNLGSSRRGMLEGVAQRGAADRIADISSGMRGNAWNTGLGYANQIASQNANLAQQNRNMQMNAAGQMANIGQAGAGLMNQGAGMFGNMSNMLGNIGQMQQDWTQQGLDRAMQDHYLRQMLPYQQAQTGIDIAMGPAQAFSTTTTETPTQGWGRQALGMAAALGGAALGGPMGGMIGSQIGGMFSGGGGGGSPTGSLYGQPSYMTPQSYFRF